MDVYEYEVTERARYLGRGYRRKATQLTFNPSFGYEMLELKPERKVGFVLRSGK
jgi:hypothetical protein